MTKKLWRTLGHAAIVGAISGLIGVVLYLCGYSLPWFWFVAFGVSAGLLEEWWKSRNIKKSPEQI